MFKNIKWPLWLNDFISLQVFFFCFCLAADPASLSHFIIFNRSVSKLSWVSMSVPLNRNLLFPRYSALLFKWQYNSKPVTGWKVCTRKFTRIVSIHEYCPKLWTLFHLPVSSLNPNSCYWKSPWNPVFKYRSCSSKIFEVLSCSWHTFSVSFSPLGHNTGAIHSLHLLFYCEEMLYWKDLAWSVFEQNEREKHWRVM